MGAVQSDQRGWGRVPRDGGGQEEPWRNQAKLLKYQNLLHEWEEVCGRDDHILLPAAVKTPGCTCLGPDDLCCAVGPVFPVLACSICIKIHLKMTWGHTPVTSLCTVTRCPAGRRTGLKTHFFQPADEELLRSFSLTTTLQD